MVRKANCYLIYHDCGVWVQQAEALFKIRIFDTGAHSYCIRPPITILQMLRLKKKKYQQQCYDRRALFTPLGISVDGMMGKETTVS